MSICKIQFKAKKYGNPAYPAELKTLGDHLRKVRLDRGLSQIDVARMLNVTVNTVTGWELNRNFPTSKYAKGIIDFIGYFPLTDAHSLGKRLYYARLITGKTQVQVASLLGCDESNMRLVELDKRRPGIEMRRKIEEYITGVWPVL